MILSKLNSPFMYAVCGGIILVVVLICIIFMARAYRMGKAIGMDPVKLKRTITASATFAILPSVGILLGVIALSGSLGTPLPWLRLSVIGALHYETQVAEAAAEAAGLSGLSASEMTAKAFTTIALLMSFCIMWGMVFSVIFTKKYSNKLNAAPEKSEKAEKTGGFADQAMTAMFIGLVSAYIGSYIGSFISDSALFSFGGDFTPLIVAAASALAMAGFVWLTEKKKAGWVDSFAVAGSMIIGMAAAVAVGMIV